MLKTIDNSIGKPNFSQRLNPDDPSTPWNETLETCNVTSAVTAMATAGWDLTKLSKGLHPRAAMDLLYFMRSDPDCIAMYKNLDPKAVTPMNEYMDVLALAIGKYLGLKDRLLPMYAFGLASICELVKHGCGMLIHGQYTFRRADGTTVQSGHFQSLAGLVFDDAVQGTEGVTGFIIDDPFGNPLTQYVDPKGDSLLVTPEYFRANVKPLGARNKDVIIIPNFKTGAFSSAT